ncbi:MAG TPA: peptidylprolyl isomerase [Acidimicrobiia bacterium]|nr:peptidylprolyl isomerase [Acidimicrobiia bacterium]
MAKQYSSQPEMTIEPGGDYSATLHTSLGDISIEFMPDHAPVATNSFLFLADEGFYDGVIFHRVIPGFVIQGGDPTGRGTGGPGYQFEDELDGDGTYTRGTVAMANAGPNTNGSQFFICHADVGLPHNYTIFGKVTAGMDVVDSIASLPTGGDDRPHDPPAIESVTVER